MRGSARGSFLAVSAMLLARTPDPGVHWAKLGSMQVICLQDGLFHLPASLMVGLDPVRAQAMLGGETAAVSVNAFLVELGGRLVLVDAGCGSIDPEEGGQLLNRLKAAGVAPDQIDLVLITHFHLDHASGLVRKDGSRAFPKAVVRMAQAEHDYWLGGDPTSLPEAFRSRVPLLKAMVAPYQAAGTYRPFKPGDSLGEGIRAHPTPGHTPGHTCYAFRAGGLEFWCIGDLLHFEAVQFQNPGVAFIYDWNAELAISSRRDLFAKAVQAHAVLAGAHLSFPGLFKVAAKGGAFVGIPVHLPRPPGLFPDTKEKKNPGR